MMKYFDLELSSSRSGLLAFYGKMSAIHVIRKNDPGLPKIEVVDRDAGIFRSGYWVVSEEKARALVGGKIYFHKGQAKPSFFGGTITAAMKVADGEYAGRVIFTFQYEETCRDIRAVKEGWAQEMKLIP